MTEIESGGGGGKSRRRITKKLASGRGEKLKATIRGQEKTYTTCKGYGQRRTQNNTPNICYRDQPGKERGVRSKSVKGTKMAAERSDVKRLKDMPTLDKRGNMIRHGWEVTRGKANTKPRTEVSRFWGNTKG